MNLFKRLARLVLGGMKVVGSRVEEKTEDSSNSSAPLSPELLHQLLNAGDLDDRKIALERVKNERPQSPAIVNVILAAQRRDQHYFSSYYSEAILAMGPVAINPLVVALKKATFRDAESIADTLEKFGQQAVNALCDVLQDDDAESDARMEASSALCDISRSLGEIVALDILPILRATIRNGGPGSYWAAEAIPFLGVAGREAIPDLLGAVDQKTSGMRGAMSALVKLGADSLLFFDCHKQPSVIAERLRGIQGHSDADTCIAFNRGCGLIVDWCEEIRPVSGYDRFYSGESLQFLQECAESLAQVLAANACHRHLRPDLLNRIRNLRDVSSEGFMSEDVGGNRQFVDESVISFAKNREAAQKQLDG